MITVVKIKTEANSIFFRYNIEDVVFENEDSAIDYINSEKLNISEEYIKIECSSDDCYSNKICSLCEDYHLCRVHDELLSRIDVKYLVIIK